MSWTYTPSALATTPLYQVRLLIGDTIQADPQLQDEEISFLLTMRSSVYGTAAECCRSIASQFSRKADSVQGQLHTVYSAQAKAYAARATDFETRSAALGGAMPYAGGLSLADKDNQLEDSDRVEPQFTIGLEDNYLPVSPAGNEELQSPEDPNT